MKTKIYHLMVLLVTMSSEILYAQQCYPAGSMPYTGTFDETQNPSKNYYINSGTGTIPTVPSGYKLWITGTAKYQIPNAASFNSDVEVCRGGRVTGSINIFDTGFNLSGMTIGTGGAMVVSASGPANLNSFNLGKIREGAAIGFCFSGPLNIFASAPWTTYLGPSTGKSWVFRGADGGSANFSNTTISNSPSNVFYVDYGSYASEAARPGQQRLMQGDPNNPFTPSSSCNVDAIANELDDYIDEPAGDVVTCTKPGVATGTASPPKFGITTLNPSGFQSRLSSVTGSVFLESKSKGFVLPRTTTSSIVSPTPGTLIYDTVEKCISLYDGTSWGCLKQTCIDNR